MVTVAPSVSALPEPNSAKTSQKQGFPVVPVKVYQCSAVVVCVPLIANYAPKPGQMFALRNSERRGWAVSSAHLAPPPLVGRVLDCVAI